MTLIDVRLMEIPPNRLGLGEGQWFRWQELEAWLRKSGYDEVADKLAGAITAPSTSARAITVRR